MSRNITKCSYCSWIDYLDMENENLIRCPECGGKVIIVDNPFADESIDVHILDYSLQKTPAVIKFDVFEGRFDKLVGGSLSKVFPVPAIRNKVGFLMKTYIWTLLKAVPDLWGAVDIYINDLKELMLLKCRKENESLEQMAAELLAYKRLEREWKKKGG